MRWRRRWPSVVVSVFAVLTMVAGGVLSAGVSVFGSTEPAQLAAGSAWVPKTGGAGPAANATPSDLTDDFCSWVLGWPTAINIVYDLFGPACELDQYTAEVATIDLANANISANNIITALGNEENASAANVANLNATFEELLSYYEGRAEAAVIPYLNQSWSNLTYAEVLDASGLVPSIEGLEFAIADQQFEIWNATAAGWDAAFGYNSQFGGSTYASLQLPVNARTTGPGYEITASDWIDGNWNSTYATFPWEYWSWVHGGFRYGLSNGTYFNLMPGGTIITAATCGTTGTYSYLCTQQEGNFTISDVTTGKSYYVPIVNYTTFLSTSPTELPPLVSKLDNIGPFDTLRLHCNANCSTAELETVGSYFTEGVSYYTARSVGSTINNGLPFVTLVSGSNGAGGLFGATRLHTAVPEYGTYACITDGSPSTSRCQTSTVYTAGNATPIGTGPGTVVGTNAYFGIVQTFRSLINNTMVMAYDSWLTLRALTANGKYTIPADCAIPTPSDAFPTATNYQTYALSANDVEGVYLGYLEDIARAFGQVYADGFSNFCGDPNLGLTFNWTASWKLALNVTASIYIGSANGTALNVNGTVDPTATYALAGTWPLRNVDPTLLYPYEYDWNVPVGQVVAVPVNDPAVGLLVNWSGNVGYGSGQHAPLWGVPTYLTLSGYGNYVYISGNNSSSSSGTPRADGDAVYISSCTLNSTPLSVCPLSVTYFNNFTYGIIHFIQSAIYISPPPSPGGLGSLSGCGFGILDAWYDSWAGYIGTAIGDGFGAVGSVVNGIPIVGGGLSYIIDGLGCIVAWIIVILIFVLFLYIAWKVIAAVAGSAAGTYRRSKSGSS